MREQCHSGKWPEYKVRSKRLYKMKLQYGETVKLPEVLYVPQDLKKLLSITRIISNGATMRSTQDKMIIKKKGVGIILDTRKAQNKSMLFYLKAKRFTPEVQYPLTDIT